jgi:hypothetical protein
MVRKELPVEICSTRVWSDSVCALHWVKQEQPATVFVRNRVKEIRELPDVVYSYVATGENSADLPTQANSCIDLPNCSLWCSPIVAYGQRPFALIQRTGRPTAVGH